VTVHPEAVAALRCPHDGAAVTLDGRTLGCGGGHRFDLARQGYVNLLTGRDPGTGDDARMVAAREEVFAAGRFALLTAALVDLAAAHAPGEGVLVDVGAGTAHHLAGLLGAGVGRVGLAVDLSKHAARRAARRHPAIAAVVADVWQGLPIGSDVASVVLCVFSPRDVGSFVRVLRPDGVLLLATPTPDHLAELRVPLGLLSVDPRKEERLERAFAGSFVPVGHAPTVTARWQLDHPAVRAVVTMGPSAAHLTDEQLRERVAGLPAEVAVTCSVTVRALRSV
jgi:23S rRNA (guanine745-N1)-methyltransferase